MRSSWEATITATSEARSEAETSAVQRGAAIRHTSAKPDAAKRRRRDKRGSRKQKATTAAETRQSCIVVHEAHNISGRRGHDRGRPSRAFGRGGESTRGGDKKKRNDRRRKLLSRAHLTSAVVQGAEAGPRSRGEESVKRSLCGAATFESFLEPVQNGARQGGQGGLFWGLRREWVSGELQWMTLKFSVGTDRQRPRRAAAALLTVASALGTFKEEPAGGSTTLSIRCPRSPCAPAPSLRTC